MASKARPGYSLTPYGNEKGRWRVKVSLGQDPATGKYRQRSKVITARTITDARRAAAAWADSLTREPTGATFGQVLDEYLADRTLTRATRAGYQSKAKTWILPKLGDVAVDQLDRRRLAAWRRTLRDADLSPATINQCIAIVKAVVNWASDMGHPVDLGALKSLHRIPDDTAQLEAPAAGQVLAMFAKVEADDPEFWLMLWVTAVTGCRRGELAGLQWQDLRGGELHINRAINQWGDVGPTKTKQRRRVVLDEGTLALLARHHDTQLARWREHTGLDARQLPDDGWIFPSPLDWSKPRNVDAITRRVNELGGGREGVWLHGLRHGVGTILAAAGVDPKTIQTRLGHAQIGITFDRYVSPTSEADRRAAEVLAGHLRELMRAGG